MATFTDRIRFVVEAVTGGAEQNLKGLRTEIAKAEGAGGRIKAGFAGVGQNIKANMVAGLAGATAAVTAFAANAIDQFVDTAREAGRLADTTGLATEEASRWLAVLRPLGVEGADLADILGNINSKAGEGRLKELGINAEDSHARLQQTIEFLGGIADETKRAQLAAELLGEEGTRQLAPLIASADTLAKKLADVSDAQIITDEERAKAAEFEDTMKRLDNVIRDLSLTIGENLIDSLEGLVPALEKLRDARGLVEGLVEKLPGPWQGAVEGFMRAGPVGAVVGGVNAVINPDTGLTSNAVMAPPGTPGVSTPAVTVNNYNYGGTDPKEVERASQDYWKRNGTANTSGRP